MKSLFVLAIMALALAGCAGNPSADHCAARLGSDLDVAMAEAERRVANGCEYQFDGYFGQLLALAEDNPDSRNPERFSDFLLGVNDAGVISRRQAQSLYNRYFGVKFVSLQGDYNTCSQACPQRVGLLADMRSELQDKELGLLRASSDRSGYYRADNLFKEAELVLEATCSACEAGGRP